MEDIYDDLENFTEEATNAELREENNNLKIKLEEYAITLNNLQKEFDMLSSEHVKLELNYSSLLKTARSEIERKTQIITKLNIEKDAMVLNSIQNRNVVRNNRKPPIDNLKKVKEAPRFGNSNKNQSSDIIPKPSCPKQVPNERKADHFIPSADLTAPRRGIESRLLDIVNNSSSNPVNNNRNNETKENIKFKEDGERFRVQQITAINTGNNTRNDEIKDSVKLKEDGKRCGARITNRRKSMPVFSMDCSKFSTDDEEVASSGSSKGYVGKEPVESRYLDKFPVEKPAKEDKILGHHEYSKDIKSRYSKHEADKYKGRDIHDPFQRHRKNLSPDRGRRRSPDRKRSSDRRRSLDRRRSPNRRRSPDRRRGFPERRVSSERNKRETHGHNEEFYKKQEYDRRRLLSPPKDKYYHDFKHRSRDSQRSNERSHLQDFEKFIPRNQDMYSMKHKLHDNEEPSGKRMRLDSNPKHEEERWRIERQVPVDMDHLHIMSCQSPDQIHSEAFPSHEATEIKLNSSTKLDDPRLTSKKYALKTHDGKDELMAVDSANINVNFVDKSKWQMITNVKMPDALLKKPITSDMPSVVLLQKPMTMPSESLDKSISPSLLDAPLQKPMTSEPHTSNSLQKSRSTGISDGPIQDALCTDIPEVLPQKPKTSHIQDGLMQKTIPSENKIPNLLIQKPKLDIVNMPDISTQKPLHMDDVITDSNSQKSMSTDDLVKEIYMDIEDISTPLESSEIYNFQNDFHNPGEDRNDKNIHDVNSLHVVEPQKSESISQKQSSYKIPKKSMQASDNSLKAKIANDMLPSDKNNQQRTTKPKTNSDSTVQRNKITDETYKKHNEVNIQTGSKITQRRSSDLQYELTAKEIIEGDLELSDETSDNTDAPIKRTIRHKMISDDIQDSDAKGMGSNKKHKLTSPDQRKIDFEEVSSQKVIEQSLEGKSTKTDNVLPDTRKSKPRKKSLKLKETKNPHESTSSNKKDDTTKEPFEKKDTSLSIDELVKIKENITKELLGDNNMTLSKDKPVKKKESKSKVLSKSKDTAPSTEKVVKKKENQQKDQNIDTVPSVDKPAKKKENKTKELSEKKETAALDKQDKKKENKAKELLELKNALSVDKMSKKKQNKPKESPENKEHTTISTDKEVESKEYKTKETKFSELFGDSSSLVSPEDLGLIPTVIAPPENYVTIFEDAQDAIDMETIRNAASSASTGNTDDTLVKTDNQSIKTSKAVEPTCRDTQEPESTINQTMYQNLQPEPLTKDTNVFKTVIISTGTQPQCTLENGGPDTELHVMQCVKPAVLQALATSTPHKSFQQTNVVPTQVESNVSNSSCSNESREASTIETPAIAISDTTTNDSVKTNNDEPDITIFVKRRRKVLKKK